MPRAVSIMKPAMPEPSGAGAGFTLVELMVVMMILSIVLGISVGAISRVGEAGALDVSERLLRSAVLRARTVARNQSALARLTILPVDAKTGEPARIAASLTRDAGTWHFDERKGSKVLAGRNNKSSLRGATLGVEGVIRGAVQLDGGSVRCDAPAGYDPTGGFTIAGYVNPDPECSSGTIFSYGETFKLSWREDGGLEASLAVGNQGETVELKTPPHRMERGVWAAVELQYDGLGAHIRIHGVVEAAVKERRPLVPPATKDRLVFGGEGFSGRLDEVLYRTLEPEEVEELPAGVEIPLKSALVVRFDAEGSLDTRLHEERVVIPLEFEGETRRLLIDRSGVLR